jgi:hypothetical protein
VTHQKGKKFEKNSMKMEKQKFLLLIIFFKISYCCIKKGSLHAAFPFTSQKDPEILPEMKLPMKIDKHTRTEWEPHGCGPPRLPMAPSYLMTA